MTASTHRGLIDRVYDRLGWRTWLLVPVLVWSLGLVLVTLSEININRLRPAPTVDLWSLFRWNLALCAALCAVGVLWAVRICAPLRNRSAHILDPERVWAAASAVPLRLTRANVILMAISTGPFVATFGATFGFDAGVAIFCLLGAFLIITTLSTAGLFAAPLLLRAFLADMGREMGRFAPVRALTLRARLLAAMPTFTIVIAMGGAGISQPSDSGINGASNTRIIVSSLVAVLIWVPAALLFARSVLWPLSDVLAGADRLKHGDYSQRIPEVWVDELGDLARSLNDAMDGMAERAQMAEDVRESRARIVAAADESRKRIERNIHDGAQQRLVALALDIRMLQSTASSLPAADLGSALDELADSVKEALTELRDLARGLHPAVLTTDGLEPALRQLASRATVPVEVTVPELRFAEQIETTGYFVVAEALANIGKYAHATRAAVDVSEIGGQVRFSITDDGIGGAAATAGSGLAGLADRVAAIGGQLSIQSPPGGGTIIVADLPVSGV